MHIKAPTAGPHLRSCSLTLSKTSQMVRIQILLVQQKAAVSSPRYLLEKQKQDFPGGTVVKNPPANARDRDSNLGPGRSHVPRSN